MDVSPAPNFLTRVFPGSLRLPPAGLPKESLETPRAPHGRSESTHEVRLLRDGAQAFPRMLEAIRRAEGCILLEMYFFSSDVIGRAFARELAARAQAGVDVLVLYDSAGSRSTPRSFFGWMRQRGVRVLEINPLRRFLTGIPFRWRDHRKLLVVDGLVAFVGGLNLSRQYAPVEQGGLGWRDTEIEIRGPIAGTLAEDVLDLWTREGGTPARLRFRSAEPAAAVGDGELRLVSTLDSAGRRRFVRSFRGLLHRARRRLWIANPYFLPPLSIRRELRRAVRRGVDVRLLMPRTSDVLPVLFASQHYYARYLRWGLRLFEWTGPMMHAKVCVVDGLWGTIGSSNLDPVSLGHNTEVNVMLRGGDIGRQLERMFEEDFAQAHEIRREEWRERGRLRRVLERVCSLFRLVL